MPKAQLRKIPTSKSPSYDQSSGRGELHTTQKWIPKATIASQPTPSTSKSPPKPLPSTKLKQLMKQMWVPKGQPLPNTSTSMPMQRTKVNRHQPVKKKPSSHIAISSTTQRKPTTLKTTPQTLQSSMKYRWIPKSILQAQGYYQGQTSIWVPKCNPLPHQRSTTSSQATSQILITSNEAMIFSPPKLVKKVWLLKKSTIWSPTIQERAKLLHQVLVHQLSQAVAQQLLLTPKLEYVCESKKHTQVIKCLIPIPY